MRTPLWTISFNPLEDERPQTVNTHQTKLNPLCTLLPRQFPNVNVKAFCDFMTVKIQKLAAANHCHFCVNKKFAATLQNAAPTTKKALEASS